MIGPPRPAEIVIPPTEPRASETREPNLIFAIALSPVVRGTLERNHYSPGAKSLSTTKFRRTLLDDFPLDVLVALLAPPPPRRRLAAAAPPPPRRRREISCRPERPPPLTWPGRGLVVAWSLGDWPCLQGRQRRRLARLAVPGQGTSGDVCRRPLASSRRISRGGRLLRLYSTGATKGSLCRSVAEANSAYSRARCVRIADRSSGTSLRSVGGPHGAWRAGGGRSPPCIDPPFPYSLRANRRRCLCRCRRRRLERCRACDEVAARRAVVFPRVYAGATRPRAAAQPPPPLSWSWSWSLVV